MDKIQTFLTDWLLGLLTGEGRNFISGLFLGGLFLFLFISFYKFARLFIKDKHLKGIRLKNSSGSFYVTKEAIKNLVIQSISHVDAIEILDIRLSRKGKRFYIEFIINISTTNSIDSLRYHLEQKILKILADNFSMRHNVKVNISVKKFLIQLENKQIATLDKGDELGGTVSSN